MPNRKYYLAHREELLAKDKVRRKRHPPDREKQKRRNRAWYERNRDRLRELSRTPEAKERKRQKSKLYRQRHLGEERARDRARYPDRKEVALARFKERYRSEPGYRERINADTAAYQREHKDLKKKWGKKYYDSHRDRESQRKKEAYRKNPEVFSARVRRYRESDPERCVELYRKIGDLRRTRERGAVGWYTRAQWMARVSFYGWKCYYCRVALTLKTLTRDHRIPLSRGGSAWPSNLVPACKKCNCSKHTRTEREFLQLKAAA